MTFTPQFPKLLLFLECVLQLQYLHHKSNPESCIFTPMAEIPLSAIDADQILNFKYVQ